MTVIWPQQPCARLDVPMSRNDSWSPLGVVAVTVSLVFLFAIALGFLLKAKTVGPGSALIAALFGFYLARTTAVEPISHFIGSLVTALSHIGH